MDLHFNAQPIYWSSRVGTDQAKLLTLSLPKCEQVGGYSIFHFMEIERFTVLQD